MKTFYNLWYIFLIYIITIYIVNYNFILNLTILYDSIYINIYTDVEGETRKEVFDEADGTRVVQECANEEMSLWTREE